jgi:flavin reductase (DIM6/NTAB) family NADH-FMN oxidoreductase RutF
VKASPCALECKWLQTLRLTDVDGNLASRFIVFGQVVGIHIEEKFIKDGLLDTTAMKPIARGGYRDYFVMTDEARFSLSFAKYRINERGPLTEGGE